MSKPDETREEALRRLDDRLDALTASRERKPSGLAAAEGGAGYRLIGELVGGVLGGLGLGWLADRLMGTGPWGAIGGMLIGTGLAIFAIARQAGSMSNQAEAGVKPAAVLEDDED